MSRTLLLIAVFALATPAATEEPKSLREARQAYRLLPHPGEAQRVAYVTELVRLREGFTRRDAEALDAIDAEVLRHPMPVSAATPSLAKRLVGRWQSPRRPYFYHADGTWASNDDTPESTGGTWRIDDNRFFQDYRGSVPSAGETLILLTDSDFVFGTSASHPYYLRRGKAFPWR